MSKKQTRRSISVSGELYERLQAYCLANGKTGSGVVEDLLRSFLGMEERAPNLAKPPIPRVERAKPVVAPNRYEQISKAHDRLKEQAATSGQPVITAKQTPKEVVITTPVLEKNGDWEKKAAPVDAPTTEGKKAGVPLQDMASKIFTF
jgi:hypothetical protein